jgi:hypothetical protein
MPQRTAPLPLAPIRNGTVYLVLDCEADLQMVVADLLCGRYRYPLRVVAFNTAVGWMRDVTAEVAHELDHELSPALRVRGAGGCVRAPNDYGRRCLGVASRVWPVHTPGPADDPVPCA